MTAKSTQNKWSKFDNTFVSFADPRQFSSALTEDENGRPLDVAPPVFTHGTKISKRKQVANVGDTFKVIFSRVIFKYDRMCSLVN